MGNGEDTGRLRERALRLLKRKVRESVHWDSLLSQASGSLEELDRAVNILVKRLREWYELHNPEFSRAVQEHERFVRSILERDRSQLLKEMGVEEGASMGAELAVEDVAPMLRLAGAASQLYQLRKETDQYVKSLCEKNCPNLAAVAGHSIAAKLIGRAGSLEELAEKAASRIQLLGAEKAMFRHLRTNARMPKHGVIFAHPLIANAPAGERGKAARALADKIAIAARVDFFRGEFVGDGLRKGLEDRFGSAG